MNGGRCSTTRIWRRPSSTASWSADGLFASTDPRDELVISSWRTPCQAVPNGSEYLEYVAQNFRNPHHPVTPHSGRILHMAAGERPGAGEGVADETRKSKIAKRT